MRFLRSAGSLRVPSTSTPSRARPGPNQGSCPLVVARGRRRVLVLGTPERSADAEERIPVYLESRSDLVRVAVTFFRDAFAIEYVPTAQTAAIAGAGEPGVW